MSDYVREINLPLILKAMKINAKILLLLFFGLFALLFALTVFIHDCQKKAYSTAGAVQINNYSQTDTIEQNISAEGTNKEVITNGAIMATQSEIEEALIKSGYILELVVRKNHLDTSLVPISFPLISEICHELGIADVVNKLSASYYKARTDSLIISSFNVEQEYLNARFTLQVTSPDTYELYLGKNHILSGKVGKNESNMGVTILITAISVSNASRFLLSKISMDKATSDLSSELMVEPVIVGKNFVPSITGILKISMVGDKPKLQAQLINDIINQLKTTSFRQQSTILLASIGFVESQIVSVSHKLTQSQADMVAFQSSHNIISLDEQQKEYIGELSKVEQDILENKIAVTQFSKLYASKHPVMIDLYTQQNSLIKKKAKVDDLLQKLPHNGAIYLNLKRNLDVYQQLYTFLLKKEQDLKLKSSSLLSPVKILYYASPDVGPATDNLSPALIAVIIFIVLVVISVLFFYIVFLDNNDPWLMSKLSQIPLLAVFPYCPKRKNTISRSLDVTRSYLLHQNENSLLIVNIGSMASGAGKSFIISALMNQLEAVNKKCLYITFGLSSEFISLAGIIKQLRQSAALANITKLKINVNDTVDSELLLELATYLTKEFDFIFMEAWSIDKSAVFFNLAKVANVSILITVPQDTRNKIEWLINDMNNLKVFPDQIIYNNPRNTIIKSLFSVESYNK